MLLERRRALPTVDLSKPALAADAEVLPPIEAGGMWMVTRGPLRLFRVNPRFAEACTYMDGTRTLDEIQAELGAPWDQSALAAVVDRLAENRILEDGQTPRSKRRVQYSPPASLQFTLLDPSKTIERLQPAIRFVSGRGWALLCAAIAVLGLVALGVQWPSIVADISQPQPIWFYFVLLAGITAATAVHEMAHATVLAAFGGRPKRIGFMFFYFMPAFFADVSDAWRLPRREQRAAVALAGITAQGLLSGVAALMTLMVDGRAGAILAVFAVATYSSGVLNLIPLVKLDGYIALMAFANVSHLRMHSMHDARSWLARGLFGARYEPELPQLRWAVPFGLACIAFPVVLLVQAFKLWSAYLAMFGSRFAMLRWILPVMLLVVAARRGGKFVIEALENGASYVRILLVSTVLVMGFVVAGAAVQVPNTYHAGYFHDEAGQLVIVLPSSKTASHIEEGTGVELKAAGVLLQPTLASATVTSLDVTKRVGPVSATTPTTSQLPQVYANTIEATVLNGEPPDSGIATLLAGETNVWTWLTRRITP